MKLSIFTLLLAFVFGLASVESCEDQGKKDKFLMQIKKKQKKKNCIWVSKKAKNRCKKTTVDGQLVKDLCPVACNNCPVEPPNGNGCCTLNYKECIDWCGNSKEECLSCSNSDVGWIPNGAPSGTCGERWADCTANKNNCCDGLTCQDQGDFFQCLPDDGSPPATAQPTKRPTKRPTNAPNATPAPTKKTKRPTKSPTKSPVPDPTPPPTNPPNANACCSVDYKSCVDYCGSTENSCMNCNDHVWLSTGPLETCGERWGGCGENNDNGHNGCCDGLTCQWRDGYDYFACLPSGEDNPQPNPTAPPVNSPTGGGGGGGSGELIKGKATMYGGNPSGGACGYNDLPQVTFPKGFSVAIGSDTFDDGYGCGACFEVTCEGPYGNNPNCFCGTGEQRKVVVQATDQCPECSSTHLDLNTEAFVSIVANQDPGMAGTCGKIETSFRRVSCDFKSNIKIRSKGGTSGFWYGLHIDDVAGYGAISSVKLREAGRRENGQTDFDIVCDKSQNASYWYCNRPGDREIFAKLDVRLTDSAGRVLKSNNVITNLNGQQEFDFGKNFEPIPEGGPTTPVAEPTTPPVDEPTPAPAPTTPFNGELLSTDDAMNAWEVFNGLEAITYKNSENPPKYAYVASGGVAGSGGSVVSEGQAYGLLITGTILASWDTHAGQVSGASRNKVLKYFEGYYNFWKEMCANSSANTGTNCQGGGKWCKSGSNSYVCLPDWKHRKVGGSEATGPAPDGDEDAIVGIILAVKAVENDNNKPSWYDEARKWADASASAFFNYEVDASRGDYRLVKLGSCWGGWESQGNNPSYHSPGSYRVMKEYQKDFPNSDRNGYSAVSQSEWKKLIDTSHEVLRAVQCSDDGALVPNWATIGTNGGNIVHTGGSFSGSSTPQYEYGAEAARTTWRVALDAAFFPEKSSEWSPYLSSFNYRLDSNFNNGSFSSNAFPSCKTPNTSQNINMFGGWQSNAFIYGPTYTSLIASSPDITNADAMVDAAGQILSNNLPSDYYPRSWAMISILMLNGAMESAGDTLKQ